ncbi:hypothetical protein VM1G_10282 [Cytospora mali]|uniref:Uncharacterized protein n=1 Tax=Cytospora mali TaxID=578113 RepID=A0A194VHI8_CYTMA|nr:hypothetical protein VM1G_10282 [Valsa mali]
MTSMFKSIFSKSSKSRPDSDPMPSYAALKSSSNSMYSVQSVDPAEEKRKAWEAKRAKEAEEYLFNHGFIIGRKYLGGGEG